MISINKKCNYCKNDFSTTNSRRQYCSSTCKTYASQVRRGHRPAPIGIANSDDAIGMTEEQKTVLMQQAQALDEAYQKIKSRRDGLLQQLENVSFKPSSSIVNKIKDLEKLIPIPVTKARLKREVELELKELNTQLQAIQAYNRNVHENIGKWEKEYQSLFLPEFRALEKRNRFIRDHILDTSEVSGSTIERYCDVQTRYPFSKMNHCLFAYLGNPVQPFFTLITGGKDTGKTALGVLLAIDFLELLKAKVLYVVDAQNQQRAIEFFAMEKVKDDNLTIKFAESLSDVEKALTDQSFEFLIIDSNTNFRFNDHNLKKLQKHQPYLSIVLIAKSAPPNIVDLALIKCFTQSDSAPHHRVINRGGGDVYINDRLVEDVCCGTFLHNESMGFSLGY